MVARCARLLAVCGVLGGVVAGCWSPIPVAQKACDFAFDPPAPTVDNDRWVVDNVPVSCDQVPQWHVLSVYLEYKHSPGEAWQQMDFKFSETPPDAVGFTLSVRGDCYPGWWRARAHAEGASGDGVPFDFGDTSLETPLRMVSANHCEQGDP